MAESPHLVVATPCYGLQVTTVYAESLLRLQRACEARAIGFNWILLGSDALITRARAELVARFLANGTASHLLFVDSDIGFEPEQALRLIDFGAEMSAAAYPIKNTDFARLRRALAADCRDPLATAYRYVYGVSDRSRIESRDGFIKACYAGTGFLMIRRDALLKLCAAHPELRYSAVHMPNDPLKDSRHRYALFECMIDRATGTYLSEDFAFCRRWTDLGGEIWIDGKSKLTHVGPARYAGDFSTQLAPAPIPVTADAAV